ncbi:hypothetical protein OIU79_027830 [Salix purpurea]|uniref:Uncharacterized protein n=1 Tax=Salix purpurea TaxID=77065 RepID=A0A9Q0VUJ2_SALPP|nr:hypothetical protein OIU79_027830 [Salix purpurea]
MSRIVNLSCQAPSSSESDARNRGVFVKGLTRFVVSDNFQVMPVSTSAIISILTKLGVMDTDTIEERTFDIGVTEVLKLLQCSLVSKTPLTDVLLAREEVPELRNEDSLQRISLTHGILENQSERNGETSVTLVVCKSKKVVCYAEASKDFVDLLFSFLTIPLAYLMNGMHGGRSRGCISHLYNSVTDLDAKKYLKSNEIKEILLNPKIVPGSGYKNSFSEHAIKTKYESSKTSFPISTMNGMHGGFLQDPAMFTVTDDLVVTPISPISDLSLLEKFKISLNDIYVCEVQVGKEEACRLLAASSVSESALTDTFMRQIPKDALISDVDAAW